MDRLLKNTRIQFGLKLQEISRTTGIDKALLSKFENGSRIPPEKALFSLSNAYRIPEKKLREEFVIAKIIELVKGFDNPQSVLEKGLDRLNEMDKEILGIFAQVEEKLGSKILRVERNLKKWLRLSSKDKDFTEELRKKLVLEYIQESCFWFKINVTNEQVVEFLNTRNLEAGLNFTQYLTLVNLKEVLNDITEGRMEDEEFGIIFLENIHQRIYNGIKEASPGKLREMEVPASKQNVLFDEISTLPPEFEDMDRYFKFNNQKSHPILLAMELVYKIMILKPFEIGNERVAFLIFNYILQKKGFPLVVFEGNASNQAKFRNAINAMPSEIGKTMLFEWLLSHLSETLKVQTANLLIKE